MHSYYESVTLWEKRKAERVSLQAVAGISRATYYRRRGKLAQNRWPGSRRPKRIRCSKVPPAVKQQVLQLRRENATYGKFYSETMMLTGVKALLGEYYLSLKPKGLLPVISLCLICYELAHINFSLRFLRAKKVYYTAMIKMRKIKMPKKHNMTSKATNTPPKNGKTSVITACLKKIPNKEGANRRTYYTLYHIFSALCETNKNFWKNLKAAVEKNVTVAIGEPNSESEISPRYKIKKQVVFISKNHIPKPTDNGTALYHHFRVALVHAVTSSSIVVFENAKELTHEAVKKIFRSGVAALEYALQAMHILAALINHPKYLDPRTFIGTKGTISNPKFPMHLYLPPSDPMAYAPPGSTYQATLSSGVMAMVQRESNGFGFVRFNPSETMTLPYSQQKIWNLISPYPEATAAFSSILALATQISTRLQGHYRLSDCITAVKQVLTVIDATTTDSSAPLMSADGPVDPSMIFIWAMIKAEFELHGDTIDDINQYPYDLCFNHLVYGSSLIEAIKETSNLPNMTAMERAISEESPRAEGLQAEGLQAEGLQAEGLQAKAIQASKNAAVSQFTTSLATGLMDSVGVSEKSKMIVVFIIQTATLMCLGASFGSAITSTTISTTMSALSTRLEKTNAIIAQAISLGSSVLPMLLSEGELLQSIYLFTLSAGFGWLGSQAGLAIAADINELAPHVRSYFFRDNVNNGDNHHPPQNRQAQRPLRRRAARRHR